MTTKDKTGDTVGEVQQQETAVDETTKVTTLKEDNTVSEDLSDNTVSSSSRDDGEEDQEDDGSSSVDNDDEGEETMPLFSYTRLFGSLPRRSEETDTPNQPLPFLFRSTCSVMGKVILSPGDLTNNTGASTSPSSNGNTTTPAPQRRPEAATAAAAAPSPATSVYYGDPLLSQQPHYVVATGFDDGSIALVDARTGVAVVDSDQLRLREGHAESVVDLSMDSSGTFLAAVDEGRMACIWEFQYTISQQPFVNTGSTSGGGGGSSSTPGPPSSSTALSPARDTQSQQQSSSSQQAEGQHSAPSTPADAGVFSSFMSAFKGSSTAAAASNTTNTTASATARQHPVTPAATTASSMMGSESQQYATPPRLATSSVQMSRISYPRSFGVPTCIAIDPSYKRKREKAVLTGFLDGRLVLTKRGYVFQRRTDAIIYQGTYDDESSNGGIEAIAWRGSLAAWADASGIRLFDTESLTRIAHIDRPTGARPSLYPTLSSLRPNLHFETSNYLLVAWGDCLMGLSIIDHSNQRSTASSSWDGQEESPPSDSQVPSSQRSLQQQPTVRRRTVECAMAWELDCVASGVVPLDSANILVLGLVPPSNDDDVDCDGCQPSNDLELQVISREDGSITFSNILPMLKNEASDQPLSQNGVAQSVITESAADFTLLSSFALPRMEDIYEVSMQDEYSPDDEFDIQVSLFSPTSQAKRYIDPHIKWDLKSTAYGDSQDYEELDGTETGSVDSDDYGFIYRPLSTGDDDNEGRKELLTPPQMIVASGSDLILASPRDIDDAIAHALSLGKSALALRRALKQKRRLRKYKISDLVNEYFSSLLRVPLKYADKEMQTPAKPLSIERLKLAAKAMPTLFGVDTVLWERWISEMQKIPGALFVLSEHIPVRDPKLPRAVYGNVLDQMLKEVEQMRIPNSQNSAKYSESIARAEQCFLNALIGWGPTENIKEHIKLCKFGGESSGNNRKIAAIREAEEWFARRFTQSAADYLTFPISNGGMQPSVAGSLISSEGYYETRSALFDIDSVAESVERHISDPRNNNSLVALDAMAKLHMMRYRYDAALKCFLFIGSLHSARPLSEFESGAIEFPDEVGNRGIDRPWQTATVPYTYLLDFINSHHLHQCLLDGHFMSSLEQKQTLPLFALLQLVGFDEMSNFLAQHCVPPQFFDKETLLSHEDDHLSTSGEERRGTLPLDLVASQFDESPKILHWYLHLIFIRKPDVYVRFPNTAYPPRAVTELHRLHFDLYVDYAGKERDSTFVLSGVEAYKVCSVTTRLLLFLKATLPLGGIRPQDARSALESERLESKGGLPATFALELAYIIDHYGEETEAEAREVLDLYMKGAKSLVLAVSFAQRNEAYSSVLWAAIMEHCLGNSSQSDDSQEEEKVDGSLFGALLEAAALAGADLAHLVTQIPPGMAIEGLRPRLVAAVADYRLKLKMHEAASEAASQEMINILRELSHRSRRGARYEFSSNPLPVAPESHKSDTEWANPNPPPPSILDKSLRTVERRDRERLCLAPALR